MDTVGCRRPRNATSSLTDLPGCPSVTSDRATSTMSAEETDTLAHSSMMSDMRRGTQRHRGMPAVMLRHISVTTLRTSLTPAGVREQQTLRLSFSPILRSMKPRSARWPVLWVMVGRRTP